MTSNKKIDDILHDPDVKIMPPDYSLKKKIGEDISIRDILTPAVIQKSQDIINSQQAEFMEWAAKDLVTLNHVYGHLKREPNSASHVKKLVNVAFSLKCQSGTFGFDLGSAIAKSLYDYCNSNKSLGENELLVIGKHVESLLVIFQQVIKGDGGKIGVELMNNLTVLINKYNKK